MQQLHPTDTNEQSSFSYTATLDGAATIITIVHKDALYDVFNKGKHIGQIRLSDNGHTWELIEGATLAPEIIEEIGQRIETYYC